SGWSRGRLAVIAAAAGVIAVVGLGVGRMWAPRPADLPLRRFEISARGPFRSAAQSRLVGVSPDGTTIAYVEAGKLKGRRVASLQPTIVTPPAPPTILFWSPDSAFLGYEVGQKLYKVAAVGGESTLIADVRAPLSGGSSASWSPDGKIYLTTGESGLL